MHPHKFKDTLLTPEQVAEQLNVSVGTLAVWRSNGTCQIPYIKIGRCVRYKLAEIEAFLVEHTHLHTHLKESDVELIK
jgi:excisionase family DNA binding protein